MLADRVCRMHISQLTSLTTSAKWKLLRCPLKVSSHLEITPHWPHSTSSSTQALNFHFSRRTFLHSHWLLPTTSSTARLSLFSWNHLSSCHQSRSELGDLKCRSVNYCESIGTHLKLSVWFMFSFLLLFMFSYLFFRPLCHVGAITCLGPVHLMCFNPLSCCLRYVTNLFVLF